MSQQQPRDEFDTVGEYVAVKDLLGNLVLFTPTEYLEEVTTDFGTKDAVLTDVVVLDAPGGPVEYRDITIFQAAMIGVLKRRVPKVGPGGDIVRPGSKVLGVIGKGEGKKGQQAPYKIMDVDDAQRQMARDYLAGRTVAAAAAPSDKSEDPFAV